MNTCLCIITTCDKRRERGAGDFGSSQQGPSYSQGYQGEGIQPTQEHRLQSQPSLSSNPISSCYYGTLDKAQSLCAAAVLSEK